MTLSRYLNLQFFSGCRNKLYEHTFRYTRSYYFSHTLIQKILKRHLFELTCYYDLLNIHVGSSALQYENQALPSYNSMSRLVCLIIRYFVSFLLQQDVQDCLAYYMTFRIFHLTIGCPGSSALQYDIQSLSPYNRIFRLFRPAIGCSGSSALQYDSQDLPPYIRMFRSIGLIIPHFGSFIL